MTFESAKTKLLKHVTKVHNSYTKVFTHKELKETYEFHTQLTS